MQVFTSEMILSPIFSGSPWIQFEVRYRIYLRVRVYSPSSLLDASRTRKVPSGVSRSFSFTSSLQRRPGYLTIVQTMKYWGKKILSDNKNKSDTWRFLPSTTRHHSAGCLGRSWLAGPLWTWPALLEELIRKTLILKLHATAPHALW